jgi:hypothetical protein
MNIKVEILNELKTSDDMEVDKIDSYGLEDYRENGYYVLVPEEMVDDKLRYPFREYLCYMSKDSLVLDNKMISMKGEWVMYSPQHKG